MQTPSSSSLLSGSQLAGQLHFIHGWDLFSNKIVREFRFGSFREAIGFVELVGELAEDLEHHPTMYLAYSRVTLELSTHSSGGVTARDVEFARTINDVFGSRERFLKLAA